MLRRSRLELKTVTRVRLLNNGTTNAGATGDIPLGQVIRDELAVVRKSRSDLMVPGGHAGIHLVAILICFLVNVGFFVARPDYFGLFIAASFYLNMVYFITLILPTNFKKTALPAAELKRLRAWLKEIGITSGTTRFTRLFINTLFMNSRALSLGISLVFFVDILFALVHYSRGLPPMTTLIVIAQCAIIISFYLLVWKIEPFSATYVKKVEQAKISLRRQHLPQRLVTGVFFFGFLLAIFLFLTTMIYLPGVTLNAFLNGSQLTELGHLFVLLAVLAVSQYFIVRSIHGISSRAMAERLFDFKESSLEDLLGTEPLPGSGPAPGRTPLELSTLLLETKIFRVRRNTIAGVFPVFVVDLDFSVLLDSSTMTAISGYIVEKKDSHP